MVIDILVALVLYCAIFTGCLLAEKKVGLSLFLSISSMAAALSLRAVFLAAAWLAGICPASGGGVLPLSVSFLLLAAVICLAYFGKYREKFSPFYQDAGGKFYIICLFLTAAALPLNEIRLYKRFHRAEVFLILLCFATAFFAVFLWAGEILKNARLRAEADIMESGRETYDLLVKEMRARQHEFNNHLNNLTNMYLACTDYDSLVERQLSYVGALKKSFRHRALVNSRQPVISGFLYTLFCKYDDMETDVKCGINADDITGYLSVIDVTEILGVLTDNAFQAVGQVEETRRKVYIFIEETGEKLSLVVMNTVPKEIDSEELAKFFQDGYSTKGESRGMGLTNVKHIIRRNKGRLRMESYSNVQESWIDIEVSFHKKKK